MIKPTYRTLSDLIQKADFFRKRIFLRADLNVPLDHGIVQDDYRLQALRPTLDLLLHHQSTVVIGTHIGRPDGADPDLSTKHLIAWFETHHYPIVYAGDFDKAYTLSMQQLPILILIENLRFFPEEKTHDAGFAQQLARLGDYYITDAFGAIHRSDTSITDVAYLFKPEQRAIGLLVERELCIFDQLLHTKKHPFILLLGGGKISDKIPFIMHMLDHVDTILLCPAIVCSFLYAQNINTGKSLVDTQAKHLCLEILKKAQEKNVQILFPTDYIVAQDSFAGPLEALPIPAHALQSNMVSIAIGPDTVDCYTKQLQDARTIVVNGLMGSVNRPETLASSFKLFDAIATNSTALRVIGGGDSVAAVHRCGLTPKIGHLSTGGGAMLALLSETSVPGLLPFFILKNGAKAQQC